MSLDTKLSRARELIGQRDAIDAELAELFSVQETRRGRPRKQPAPTEPALPEAEIQ
jgi:hypothetical protein